jgi:two-component system invasion response regulator UvrY
MRGVGAVPYISAGAYFGLRERQWVKGRKTCYTAHYWRHRSRRAIAPDRNIMRVLLADDHPIVRAGVRELLAADPTISEIGEAASGNETLQRLRLSHWHLLILDIDMPDRNGLDVLLDVVADYPDTKVLVLSGFPERQYALGVLKTGAGGYLGKERASEDLLAAVHVVLEGRRYVSAELAQTLAANLELDSTQPMHCRLSAREFQVFYKIATGQSVKAIGLELCLSAKTVSTYRSRMMEKMRFLTNADATTYALRNELIQ